MFGVMIAPFTFILANRANQANQPIRSSLPLIPAMKIRPNRNFDLLLQAGVFGRIPFMMTGKDVNSARRVWRSRMSRKTQPRPADGLQHPGRPIPAGAAQLK
jgi:hypothetical protein